VVSYPASACILLVTVIASPCVVAAFTTTTVLQFINDFVEQPTALTTISASRT
jgi:hypothetical protein